MIHGRNLIVSLDGVAIAGAKSCRLSIAQEFIKACSPTASRVFDKIPTTYDWGVSADCLIPASTLSVSLTDKLIAGTKCLLTFTDGTGQKRAGFVYVKSCDESGSVGSLATFNASFESSGELYKYIQFTPTYFSESRDAALLISNNTMSYEWQRGDGLLGVQITSYTSGMNKLYIRNPEGDNWGLYKAQFSTIKGYCANSSSTDLNNKLVNLGKSHDVVTINLNTSYTFLTNDDGDEPPALFLLYQ